MFKAHGYIPHILEKILLKLFHLQNRPASNSPCCLISLICLNSFSLKPTFPRGASGIQERAAFVQCDGCRLMYTTARSLTSSNQTARTILSASGPGNGDGCTPGDVSLCHSVRAARSSCLFSKMGGGDGCAIDLKGDQILEVP